MKKTRPDLPLLICLIILIATGACDKDKNPTSPNKNESPIPLKVGNTWIYEETSLNYKYPDWRTEFTINSTTLIENKTAYVVNWLIYNPLKTLMDLKLAWLWDKSQSCFYEYEDNYDQWKKRKAFKYPSSTSDKTDWGYYITQLTQSKCTIGNYENCTKYTSTNKSNSKSFEDAIKEGIGFVMITDDLLKSYALPKAMSSQSIPPLILRSYKIN